MLCAGVKLPPNKADGDAKIAQEALVMQEPSLGEQQAISSAGNSATAWLGGPIPCFARA